MKKVGNWTNNGGCEATGANKTCGPGNQKQKRNCTHGTIVRCTAADMERSITCTEAETKLVDCPKLFGNWTNDGGCMATGANTTCGPGIQKLIRTCTNGTTDKCTPVEMESRVTCSEAGTNLEDCPKVVGSWKNYDECVPFLPNMTCGPGNQTQTRQCFDGTTDKCTPTERKRIIRCDEVGTELDCRKIVGPWKNESGCEALGENKTCGPGNQKQKRTCIVARSLNVTCTKSDRERTISCTDAGTGLPDCPKILGNWTNDGQCMATGDVKTCGPGNQTQKRPCADGTRDKCSDSERQRIISCKEAGQQLPACPSKTS